MNKQKIKICRATLLAVVAILIVLSAPPAQTFAQTEESETTGYVSVNGLDYFYEIHGEGEPLLLLHGGLGSIDMLEPILPTFTENRQVIGVDLHGHGRTALGDRPVSYIDMGDDLAILLKELGYDQVDVMGYSMGGGVALRLSIQHPEIIRRLVAVSAGFAREGFYPEIISQQEQISARKCRSDEGNADVSVLCGDRAKSGGFSEASRSHRRVNGQAVQLVRRRQKT